MATPKHADAWRHTYAASLALAVQFAPTDWDRPTGCPGWSVRDVVAHLIGGERWTMGEPLPTVDLPELPRVHTDFQVWAEIPVQVRRHVPTASLVAELREVYELRSAQLDTLDGAAMTPSPWGYEFTVEKGVATRVFDCWTHEQDLRAAVGRPGNLDSPAARVVRATLLHTLPRLVAREAGAPAGSVIRFDVTGALPFDTDIAIDADNQGVPAAANGPATVTMSMDWAVFAQLCSGRIAPNAAPVTYLGDVELGLRVARSLVVTP